MHPIHIIVQARMGSTRLPGKVLADIGGEPMLLWVVRRCRASALAHGVVIATTDLPEDDPLAELCAREGIACSRGSSADVLKRYADAARKMGSAAVVRVTSDCPLIDPITIDRCLARLMAEPGVDYVSNTLERTFPRGLDVEAFTAAGLAKIDAEATRGYEREHVTPRFYENPDRAFRLENVRAAPELAHPELRLTVDTAEDLRLVRELHARLRAGAAQLDARDAVRLLTDDPALRAINADTVQKSYRAEAP
jgi:spore coat polysaccharide biosynthesis protein SpsF